MNQDFNHYYELWMKQSKEFFESANQHLGNSFQHPEEHGDQVEQWLKLLKNQWQFNQVTDDHKSFKPYWEAAYKMYQEASDMMMKQWIERSHSENPITNSRELYELWLDCCHQIYKKSMATHDYQQAYGEFINATLHYWKSVIPS